MTRKLTPLTSGPCTIAIAIMASGPIMQCWLKMYQAKKEPIIDVTFHIHIDYLLNGKLGPSIGPKSLGGSKTAAKFSG